MRRWVCLLGIVVAFNAVAEEDNAKVYRWIGEDGSMVFSTTPPPKGVNAQEIKLRDADTIIHEQAAQPSSRPAQRPNGAPTIKRQSIVEQRASERELIKRKIGEIEKRLEEARQEYNQGEAPQPGERQAVANSSTVRSRLSEAYFQRREEEKQKVETLEKQLDGLWEEYNQVR